MEGRENLENVKKIAHIFHILDNPINKKKKNIGKEIIETKAKAEAKYIE